MTVEKEKINALGFNLSGFSYIFFDIWAVIFLTIRKRSNQNWEGWWFVKTKYDNISRWDTNMGFGWKLRNLKQRGKMSIILLCLIIKPFIKFKKTLKDKTPSKLVRWLERNWMEVQDLNMFEVQVAFNIVQLRCCWEFLTPKHDRRFCKSLISIAKHFHFYFYI